MPFPISLSGCVAVDTAYATDICRGVGRILERQRADIVIESDDHVVLRVPMVRGSGDNSDFVTPLNRIELRLRHGDGISFLCYRLSVLRTAALTFVMPPILVLFAAAVNRPLDAAFSARLLLGGWIALIGGNCGVVWFRARPFFERAVREAVESSLRAEQSSRAPTAT